MKESLNYYYNLNIAELENNGQIYSFKLNNQDFYFVPFTRREEELKDILNVSQELNIKGLYPHTIIPNIFGSLITNVYNSNYCLLSLCNNYKDEISLEDIIKISAMLTLNPTKSSLYRISWNKLWSDKIDYFEYQISELGKEKILILNSISYYIGLGENAINYVSSTLNKYKPSNQDKICLSHRRINYPNYKLNYLNPISFIFDYEIRDIAEYLKSAFFKDDYPLNYLKQTLKTNQFSIFSLSLLYARLLYPTYYFDIYEQIMNKEESEEKLIPIIEKIPEYEKFLQEAYYEINKYAPIERIEWLLKKEL